jgi:DNA-binding transcriptional LysR family regulator
VQFDPRHLESFLAVATTRSFTQGARRRGIGQPAISQHVRRLEASVGRQLLVRDTHSVELTVDGEAMVGFARSILAAQEQAAAYFTGERLSGRLRLGLADDLALAGMPQILREFRADNPLVDLELTVDQSGTLNRRLDQNRLDLFLGKRSVGDTRGELIRRERLVWVGLPTTRVDRSRPLPLVIYPAPSISRLQIEQALERAAIPWRTVCLCRGVNGLIAAVAGGVGISAMARGLIPPGLVELGPVHRLPELGSVDLVLISNPRAAEKPSVKALSAMLLAGP